MAPFVYTAVILLWLSLAVNSEDVMKESKHEDIVLAAAEPCIEQVGSCACRTASGWINLQELDSRDKNNPR